MPILGRRKDVSFGPQDGKASLDFDSVLLKNRHHHGRRSQPSPLLPSAAPWSAACPAEYRPPTGIYHGTWIDLKQRTAGSIRTKTVTATTEERIEDLVAPHAALRGRSPASLGHPVRLRPRRASRDPLPDGRNGRDRDLEGRASANIDEHLNGVAPPIRQAKTPALSYPYSKHAGRDQRTSSVSSSSSKRGSAFPSISRTKGFRGPLSRSRHELTRRSSAIASAWDRATGWNAVGRVTGFGEARAPRL